MLMEKEAEEEMIKISVIENNEEDKGSTETAKQPNETVEEDTEEEEEEDTESEEEDDSDESD